MEIRETKLQCPKCKSKTITLTEHWTGMFITFEQEDGKIDHDFGVKEPGEPYVVVATCLECNIEWRIAGVTQITEIYL